MYKIYVRALFCALLITASYYSVCAFAQELAPIHLHGETVEIGEPVTEILREFSVFIEQEQAQEFISDALRNVLKAIQEDKAILWDDLYEALPEIITYIERRAELEESNRAGVTTGAPLTCDLGAIVQLLRDLHESINTCCAIIDAELQYTSSLVVDIALDLDNSTSSIIALAGTFSTFEAITDQLVATVSLLDESITDLAATVSTFASTFAGTFTAIDACCTALSQDFINTNTLLLSEFNGTYSSLNQGFDAIASEFQSTWSQLSDISGASCCLSEFQSTWSLLHLLDSDDGCRCLSQFQQTWTILNSLVITLSVGCDCSQEFEQTWQMLGEGFGNTSTHFQGTFTVVQAGFQGTFSILDQIHCGYTSLFGEKEQSSRLDWLDTKFNYGVSSYDVTTSTFSSGFVSSFTSMALVETGASSGGFAQIQSKHAIPYRAGHETYAIFSAQFSNGGVASSTQWIGLFDSQNGFAVGFSNTSFALLYRNAGVNTIILQDNFNQDPLDGTGPSGFVLNPSRLNLFRLSFGWLGASPIKFQILNTNGKWITFHEISRNNQFFVPNVRNPYLPMTAQVNKNGGAQSVQIGTSGWNGGIIGEPSNVSSRYFSIAAGAAAVANTTEQHVLTLRNKPTFQSIANKIAIRISFLTIGAPFSSSSKSAVMRLYKNATVTGSVFSDVDTANSVTEASTAGIYTGGSGQYLMSFLAIRSNPAYTTPIEQTTVNIILEPNETATFTYQLIAGSLTGGLALAYVSWEELF